MNDEPVPQGTPLGARLFTPDPPDDHGFYAALLGWGATPAGAGTLTCHTADGTTAASLHPATAAARGWVVSFAAADPDPAVLAALVHEAGGARLPAGAEAAGSVTPGGGDTAVVIHTDPGGVPFAVAGAGQARPTPPGIGRPSWYELMTSAPTQADAFYATVFGYTLTAPPGTDPPTGPEPSPYTLYAAAGRPVAGRLHLTPELASQLGERWMVYFAHPDVDAAAPLAAELGATVLVPPRDTPTGRVTALRDPTGAVFTLLRPHSAQEG